MKKHVWKWVLAFCLLIVLSILPMENALADEIETEYWEPFGNDDFTMEFEWEKNCDYEVLETENLGEMHSVHVIFSNFYKADVPIKVSSSNSNIIAIYPSSQAHIGNWGYGQEEIVYTIEGFGVASIIFDVDGHTIEKEIIVVPHSTDLEKIEKVDYNSIKLTWEKQPAMSGFIIERACIDEVGENYGEYTTYATTTNDANSIILDVEWDTKYAYRVVPYINKGTKKLYAENQGKEIVYILEGIAAEIKSVKQSGSSSLQISWNKVSGTTGYKVYRSEYENEGYKCVYTAKSNKTTSWKQKVEKGKRYYYRVVTIFPDRQSTSQSVAQLIPKYSKAKVQTLSGVKGVYTTSRIKLGRRISDEQYYYVANGKLHIVAANTAGEYLIDYTLNSKGEVTAKKKISYKMDKLGGVYRAADGNFYVVGSMRYSESRWDEKNLVALSVIQYNSKWKKIKTANYVIENWAKDGCDINSSNCAITMRENELYIHLASVKDNSNSASNVAFRVNCNDMSIRKATISYGYNSSQQEAVFKDEGVYLLTHSSTEIAVNGIADYPDTTDDYWHSDALPISGVKENGLIGCGVGGMEVGNKNILVCGISARNDKNIKLTTSYPGNFKDVFLSVIDRETGKVKLKWLTSYNKKNATTIISDTRMVKLSEDRYAILYSTTNTKGKETMHYVVVNNAGKKIYSTSYTGMHFTGASEPILYNGNLVWMEGERCNYKNGKPYDKEVLYQIPAIYEKESNVGKTFTYKNNTYKIMSKSTVAYTGTKNKKATKIEIPAKVSYSGQTYKVTSIADKALQKNKKIKTVVIGSNVNEIGKSAFSGCSKLSTIEVKSKSVKQIGKNALKGIKSNATIKVPKAKLTAYKKLFKGKGQSSKVKWKKI